MFENGIFIFTRSLRLSDNLPLFKALKECKKVLPIFILNPEQITEKNKYNSKVAVKFMIESLEILDKDLKKKGSKLFMFFGEPKKVIADLIKKEKFDAVYEVKDYTPFAKKRSESLSKVCKKYKLQYFCEHDLLLNPIEDILNKQGKYYSKFTPYFKTARLKKINKPIKNLLRNYYSKNFKKFNSLEFKGAFKKFYDAKKTTFFTGGRNKSVLNKVKKNCKHYDKQRDFLAINATSMLSPYIKFGCFSIREIYWFFKENLPGLSARSLIRQLYWRDFYYNLAYHHKKKLSDDFRSNKKIRWTNNRKVINALFNSKTGIPLLDASVNQLKTWGWVHNRARLTFSSFATKVLKIDWRILEKFYAEHLVDYDPIVNNGNFEWAAGTGADSQPYNRYLNPFRQVERFDSDAKYLKYWVKELKDVPAIDLCRWDKKYNKYPKLNYPKPIAFGMKRK